MPKREKEKKERNLGNKYDPTNLFLETQSNVWFGNEVSTDTKIKHDLPPMPALGADEEELKEGKVFSKILTQANY